LAYGPQSKSCTFSDALMAEANQRGWNVIGMKNDWKTVHEERLEDGIRLPKQEPAMNANGAFKVSVTAIDKEITMNICSDGPAAALSGFSPARVVVCALLSLSMLAPAHAEMSAEELAKLAQNPVGNLISVPFQNNTNLNFGPEKKTQNILNIQPVIPISVNDDWNIITRTIVPVISMPGLYPGDDRTNGIGDTVLTAFVSPAKPGSWIWGVGPVAQIPTNTDNELGNKNWGLGPSVGPRSVCRRLAPRKGEPVGLWRASQQHLVAIRRQAGRLVQQRDDPALRQLQLPGGLICGQCSDHHG